ncbi:glucose-methanol-choline oxidoreductase-like protein [Pseudomassariella vexata]|uniref:Glucose-methanol-choline oxidoreductase-like protein n=1 Tax=Pseudomassariella vexata TaxID=1141098 RepID=A0A1Y2DNU5_9PEZI|nr:glucose-methanol-choline oxidoreductase-like protein [Pseudomassariella vexata]ORY60920.1 glucose-methanol-choline oxidoreductase-like protein [Pseudomassariella vexata]
MLFQRLFGLLATSVSVARAVDLTGYEYVVVGSGAGGGPLAARLALAGHKTLLIEAGDDHGQNDNYTVPAYSAKSSEDPAMSWNFFVRHYADNERQARDYKTTYDTADGGEYTGTLGGCTAHNALIAVYPHQSDFEYIANLTGDDSWSAENMRTYFTKMEKNQYLLPGINGHGYDGWLQTETAPLTIPLEDPQLLEVLTGGALALGNVTDSVFNLASLLLGDANADSLDRDLEPGFYQIPLSTNDAHRTGSREFVVAVRDAVNDDGTKMYPLDVRMNCFVTKVVFDNSTVPRATGVEFLDGEHLYSASPLSTGAAGTPGSATASREVIVAGGVYNSPQLLKLSGVGPADELNSFGIHVVSDLPGVGTNLQDHYEISVQGRVSENFTSFDDCTFGFNGVADPCLDRWAETEEGGNHGIYSSSGLAAAMFYTSSAAEGEGYDIFAFGGPVNFRGYFPTYSTNATIEHDWFTWAILKAHPRNSAGTVTLRSADPLDMPDIVFNYFDTGVGDYDADLQALYEAVELARDAFDRQLVNVTEVLPGADVTTPEDIKQYAQDTAWGHHASSTCPIGTDDDPMAVLDSNFKVRGVTGLRVVDASVYPRIPGTFTAVSTYMVAEKAADVILAELAAATK